MPLYEYECKEHGHRFEVRHGVNETPELSCPECGGAVRKMILPVGIVFKGSGFYATDSRSSNSAAKPADKSSGKSDGAAKTETKSETKSDSAAS